MDKIARIRQEIKRQMKFYDEKEREVLNDPKQFTYALFYQGHQKMCAKFLSLLDTLSGEPDKGLEEEMKRFIDAHYHTRFDETLENGNDPLTVFDFEDIACHFAEWGAEHLRDFTKKIDKSLEEAAEEYRRESFKRSVTPQIDGPVGEYGGNIKSAFKAGWKCRDDQMPMPEDTVLFQKGVAEGRRLEREDMLKDAVEGTVNQDGILELSNGEAIDVCPSLDKCALGLQLGKKVKLIIVKDHDTE